MSVYLVIVLLFVIGGVFVISCALDNKRGRNTNGVFAVGCAGVFLLAVSFLCAVALFLSWLDPEERVSVGYTRVVQILRQDDVAGALCISLSLLLIFLAIFHSEITSLSSRSFFLVVALGLFFVGFNQII